MGDSGYRCFAIIVLATTSNNPLEDHTFPHTHSYNAWYCMCQWFWIKSVGQTNEEVNITDYIQIGECNVKQFKNQVLGEFYASEMARP